MKAVINGRFYRRSARDVVLDEFGVMEHFVQRLQHGVTRAYWSRNHFQVLVREALAQFERDLNAVLALALNARPPAYVSLHRASRRDCAHEQQVAQRFMTDWESVINETDTKLTRL